VQAMNVEVWELWRIVCAIESLHNDIKFRNNLRVRGTAAHKKSLPYVSSESPESETLVESKASIAVIIRCLSARVRRDIFVVGGGPDGGGGLR